MAHQNGATGQPAPPRPSRWSRFKAALIRTEQEFTVFKGLTFVSVLGTILVGYFQYLSAYEDKVSTQYKEDFTAATAAFTEISNEFATGQTLQQLLFFNYLEVAATDAEKNAKVLPAKSAREIYKTYSAARTSLRQNVDVLARKVEMQIDWASNRKRDPGEPRDINVDPLSRAKLGEYNFDCDDPNNMPHFAHQTPKTEGDKKFKSFVDLQARDDNHNIVPGRPKIHIDWYSAKHHLWTMFYCFEGTHNAIAAAREWASDSQVDDKDSAKFVKNADAIRAALDLQVLRLQAFMSLAMLRIENIRVRYRPNGFLCHIPILREIVDLTVWNCTPIHKAIY